MEEKFLNIIADVLEVEVSEISMATRFKEMDEWDSLSQLTLIADLDENFGVTIPNADLEKISTLEELYEYVNKQK